MAAKKDDKAPKRDPLADEIDALLKKLPHAESEPATPKQPQPAPRAASVRPAGAPAPTIRPPRPPPPARRPPIAVWARVFAGAVLAVAFTQWPYAQECGWGLLAYGGAVGALLIVGGWCAVEAWRAHMGVAHVMSLIVTFWGVALAAEVLLPRIGYAADSATWRCVAEAPVTPQRAPVRTPSAPPAAITPSDQPVPNDTMGDTMGDSATGPAETSPDSVPD
jgi:hypothetical protein